MMEIVPIVVFFMGMFGLMTSKNIIKSIACLVLLEMAVIVFILGLAFRTGILPPVGQSLENVYSVADPLPQALMITAIIIGLAVTAIDFTMIINLVRRYKSTDWDEVKAMSTENFDEC
ncbi:MAG: cation:proton antiporter subunit C [Oscillospiraceae bacterium]|nr:cation:proton antiporter subunit C [Oscillospiraceae bacterium]